MSKRSRSISRSPSVGEPLETSSRPSSPAFSITSVERPKKHLSDTANSGTEVMHCSLPPHRETLSFPSYDDYEVHYKQTHVNRCTACGKNFPTDRFLNLHIEENHDPLIAAKKDRGEKTYGCFIEDCERKCSTPQKRRMHLIDKHMFPKRAIITFARATGGKSRRKGSERKHRCQSSITRVKLPYPTTDSGSTNYSIADQASNKREGMTGEDQLHCAGRIHSETSSANGQIEHGNMHFAAAMVCAVADKLPLPC
ncbi:hypothetical protein F9C07_10878 [Aspergillus flavus]|uniref:C2H2-type domain-containing protein n=2 Tax=Aspergillus subgen. Circumdati TaxID=2720871 RepID=A0A7U2QZL2_ASPFN|nr:hypothetical protein Ao3042_01229 [Aspergillus oryzae 3.042]KDE77393.1 hypothetical protein AO1008_03673 [Aspergillus oryzae 100-8]KOC07696.1 hypothetical protein AFLA70_15g004860 [Aspergillus flavus AF70]QRD88780.1 hypothetical protein F9C07_10878 [Aspergillus flavus]|eukprot:EIT72625.1 hypothetical protein Ao3042_01229 [Aspergillus oryzae 3.042]